MPDWSIKIVPAKHPKRGVLAEFVGDVVGAPVGKFDVQQGDLVSWNNTTSQDHWPWPLTGPTAQPQDPLPFGAPVLVSGAIKPADSSDDYNVAAAPSSTIWYCCKLHPAERACLVVVPFGQSSADAPSA
jgi:hypothetical protein